ncbi:hypothetical protein THRCLA_07382 [Thraustotheca clavata]|uniref:Uncharacterized protein n=1 Tax=Thraustotheca clavata TaxID=74557 RepID=A0A1V9ZDI9_9STRA|nr:hypothetical protein THRCLA_07382 [Thraustotheca clavata]
MALSVLVNRDLFDRICAFQAGWPLELLNYYRGVYKLSGSTLQWLDFAASTGNIPVLEIAMHSRVFCVTSAALDQAARHGHLKTVAWLDKAKASCTIWAMNEAARRGHLEIVRYLHHNRSEGCSTYALHHALIQQHWEIVNFLQNQRHEGCSSHTLVQAVQACQLQSVEFIFRHGYHGSSGVQAMDLAATLGHFHIVQFLHIHNAMGCTTQAIDGGAQHGHVEIVEFLLQHRTEGFTRLGIERAKTDRISALLAANTRLLQY